MSPEYVEVCGAGAQGCVQIEPAAGTSRPASQTVAKADHHRGTLETFHHLRGHDSHHTRMPPFGPDHDGRCLCLRFGLGAGRGPDLLLNPLPRAIDVVDLQRLSSGFLVILAQQQVEGPLCLAEAPRRVEPRGQPEADRAGVDGCIWIDLGDLSQCAQAGSPPGAELA